MNLAYYKAGEAFDSVIDGDDFEQVALVVNKKVIRTKEFTLSGDGLDTEDNAGFAKVAFGLPLDDISDVKQFGDSYYLIRVIKKIKPVIQGFDIVKARVVKELAAKLQKEKAKQDAKLYLTKAVSAKSLDQLVKEYPKLKLRSTNLFARNDNIRGVGNSSEFTQASFSLNENNKIYPEIIETSSGYSIIGFKEKKIPDDSEISKNLKTVKNEIIWKKQTQSYQAWVNELKKHSKINYNPEALN
ncbi:MAG: peptidyl-prolyl cis-trans isomerase [Deltaproteobacteria bacterium]|nr:peptidyl-prolyl cis-trans isomerase [Deltaproteobacteria bacterium]